MSGEVVLVTGGAGFIGSHTVVELLEANYQVVVVDNLVNSSEESLRRVERITNKKILAFYKVDICDEVALEKVFEAHPTIRSVIHFAGLKAVLYTAAEIVTEIMVLESPDCVGDYIATVAIGYNLHFMRSTILFQVMQKYKVKDLVFSSSATVYGDVKEVPEVGLDESMPTQPPTNPYGTTKLFIETILRDTQKADKCIFCWIYDDPAYCCQACNFVILRYFNPVGAHSSGLIGEDPRGIPNNLMPYVTQVAVGKRPFLSVYGNDYPTKDGTGVRDYIHVVDLAKGHIAALRILSKNPGYAVYNLGTGKGNSVLDMVNAMKKASGRQIEYKFVERRPGDIAVCFASPEKAKRELGWTAQLGVDDMCKDAWNWQVNNPDGFAKM